MIYIFLLIASITAALACWAIYSGFGVLIKGHEAYTHDLRLRLENSERVSSERFNEIILLKDYSAHQTEYPPNRVTIETHDIITLHTSPHRVVIEGSARPEAIKERVNRAIANSIAKELIDQDLIEIQQKDDMSFYGMGVPPVKLFRGLLRVMNPKASNIKHIRGIHHGEVLFDPE